MTSRRLHDNSRAESSRGQPTATQTVKRRKTPLALCTLGASLRGALPAQLIDLRLCIGEWYHIGYHMTAAVASVPTLGLPFAVSLLGWGGGLVALIAGGLVTMFTSFLVSSMLEYGGKRHIRFRDLSVAVFGAQVFPTLIFDILCG